MQDMSGVGSKPSTMMTKRDDFRFALRSCCRNGTLNRQGCMAAKGLDAGAADAPATLKAAVPSLVRPRRLHKQIMRQMVLNSCVIRGALRGVRRANQVRVLN